MDAGSKNVEQDFDMGRFIADLKSPWMTMESDMSRALSIIKRYSDDENSSDDIEIVSVTKNSNHTKIQFPDWLSEVEKQFINEYGVEKGRYIFKKVVMRLYLLSNDKGPSLH